MPMKIKFGVAGLGGIKEAVSNLEHYKELGIKACEIAFTYGVYIKNKEDAVKIGKAAKKLGISLSIHAPYWINLNSADAEKIKASKQRILDCLKVGTWLNASVVVFHPGYYYKFDKQETYENIKSAIKELQAERKKNNYTPRLAPETTGKVNVFGSVEEIKKLVDETGCEFCIDFAHILAREKSYCFEKVKKAFSKRADWHVHFSGIAYGEKGEKRHKKTNAREWKKLLQELPKNKNITIINEAPTPVQDAAEGLEIYSR